MTNEPTRRALAAVCAFALRFDESGFVAGKWISPEPLEDGVTPFPYWSASEDVAQWEAALYEHHIVWSFDWTEPDWTRQMRHYHADPNLLGRAPVLTVRKVLTTLVRADRFCEGTLARAFERGVPQAAMQRLGAIAGE